MGGVKIQRAAVSGGKDFALAVSANTGEVILIRSLSGTESVSYLPGIYTGGTVIAISPDESVAAIYSSSARRIQVIRGLPSDPVIEFEADTSGMPGQSLTSMAISSLGNVMAGFSDGTSGSLQLFSAGAPAGRFMADAGHPSAIAFSLDGALAVATDRLWNQVVLFQDISTGARIQLAEGADGISDPVGIFLSRDAGSAYVANAGSHSVSVIPLAGGAARSFPCDCILRGMQRLRGDSIFALTEKADEPVTLFVAGDSDPYFVTVPPAKIRDPIPFIFP
jgi:hypothetical protein